MEVFGITGTNGKTTTAYMLDEILHSCGESCALIGTITHRIGDKEYEAINTTPGRASFKKYFNEAEKQGIDTVIAEVSSHALAQGRVDEVPITYAAFTNLTQDHMDYHGNMEEYFLSKKKLFDFNTLKASIINIDDGYGRRLYSELKKRGRAVFSVSLTDTDADYFAEATGERFSGTSFVLTERSENGYMEKADISIMPPGKYNIYNAVTAIALARQQRKAVSLGRCAEYIAHFKGAPGRFEITEKDGIIAVCDYAHTPDALFNLLKTVSELRDKDERTKAGRIITVFGCGGDRDADKRPKMGKIAGEWSDYIFITSDNPRNEEPSDIINQIAAGLEAAGDRFEKEASRREAIRKAVRIAKAGDIIVVAGKGHETYQIIGNEKVHFDDREILREYL